MTPDDEGKIADLLADLWQRHLPLLHERLNLLDRVSAEASSGALAETSRLEGLSVAHKLSGNLGMFGHQHGTEIASQIEQILKTPTPDTLITLAALATDLRLNLAHAL